MKKILIVADDTSIEPGLESTLRAEGFETHLVRSGPDCLQFAFEHKPDLLILDAMLPDTSGHEICIRLRSRGMKTPVIMLTFTGEQSDKARGMESGADDYLAKPFSMCELLARVRAHLAGEANPAASESHQCTLGNVIVDFKRQEVHKAGQIQDLTNREYRLLEYFVQHPGELLSREKLLLDIWGYEVYFNTRTVDNHIMRLRKLIEPDPQSPRYIKTVRGVGYVFEKR